MVLGVGTRGFFPLNQNSTKSDILQFTPIDMDERHTMDEIQTHSSKNM